ncbi:MAG: YeeE/YedE thiosulfate transporter family protein [Polyangia bacterium]|jgi:uncharacterized membrane protein YedE/YeeE|nr:YeeE/YedE thiosulfate transporter family protein [Polyangia bacterium]
MSTQAAPQGERPYLHPYLAGIGLGLALLMTFVLVGRGLGASGAFTRANAAVVDLVAPDHARTQAYWKKYTTQKKGPLDDFLIYQTLGLILGAMASGFLGRRLRWEVTRGPRISQRARLGFAVLGGVLAGFGARLAGGCTSGLALTGGATLALGGWIFMLSFFAAGFAGAALIRRQWL